MVISFSFLFDLPVPSSAEIWSAILVNNEANQRAENEEKEGDKQRERMEYIDNPYCSAAHWYLENGDKFSEEKNIMTQS